MQILTLIHGLPASKDHVSIVFASTFAMLGKLEQVGTEDFEPVAEDVVLKQVENLRHLLASADLLQRKRFQVHPGDRGGGG